jgi:hypothetical protein
MLFIIASVFIPGGSDNTMTHNTQNTITYITKITHNTQNNTQHTNLTKTLKHNTPKRKSS